MKAKAVRRSLTKARAKRPAGVHAASPGGTRIRSILVPTDFSAPAQAAIEYAVQLASQYDARLTLLHVIEPVATPDFAYYPLTLENDKVMAAAKKHLDQMAAKLKANLVEKTLVRNGVAFHEIARAAQTLKADLIVISTHGYTGLKHILLGSRAERVVRHAPCPVLVVRGG